MPRTPPVTTTVLFPSRPIRPPPRARARPRRPRPCAAHPPPYAEVGEIPHVIPPRSTAGQPEVGAPILSALGWESVPRCRDGAGLSGRDAAVEGDGERHEDEEDAEAPG